MINPDTPIKDMLLRSSRYLLLSLFSAVSLMTGFAQAATNAPVADRIFFRNGDVLTGKLLSLDSQSGIQWSRSDAVEPIAFHTPNVTSIDLCPSASNGPWPSNSCRVRLEGDDIIEGVIQRFDSNGLRIATAAAGSLLIPKTAVGSITMIPPPQQTVYEGPTGLEGWIQGASALAPIGSGQWTYRNGAFYASKSASIARDLQLPATASIQFDLRWQTMFQLAVALYADSPHPVSLNAKDNEPPFGPFYSFQMNNTMADLLAVRQNEPQRTFDPAMLQTLNRTNRAHIDLRINKTRGIIVLLIDGALVKGWTDPAGFIAQGTYLRFVNQGLGPVKISNLRISHWDGSLEELRTQTFNWKRDALRLDDSIVQGDVMSIEGGKITINKTEGITQIPLARLKQLDFSRTPPARAGTAPANMRVFFGQNARLAIQLESFDGKTLRGMSANLGNVQIDGSAIKSLQMLK